LYGPAKGDYRASRAGTRLLYSKGGREAMYIGVGTILLIVLIVLLVAFVF
jgi:hypothetical protein